MLVGLMFPAQVTIMPIYLGFAQIGLLNRPIGLALMYLTSSFGVFLVRQFMRRQPKALEEAALMDGAGYFKIFCRISLPQLRPALSALGIITFTQTWNYYFQARVLLEPQEVDDAADRHGPAARLSRLRQPLGGHGRDEHVRPAGRPALPPRPEVRDRRHHHERHQELEKTISNRKSAQCCRRPRSIDDRFAYTGERARYVAFPLGGIGTGSFSFTGSGRLIDWTIRNRPALAVLNGYSHFAIKAEQDGKLVDARVLNGPYDRNAYRRRRAARKCSTASATAPTARRWPACRTFDEVTSSAAFRSPTSSSTTQAFRARCA